MDYRTVLVQVLCVNRRKRNKKTSYINGSEMTKQTSSLLKILLLHLLLRTAECFNIKKIGGNVRSVPFPSNLYCSNVKVTSSVTTTDSKNVIDDNTSANFGRNITPVTWKQTNLILPFFTVLTSFSLVFPAWAAEDYEIVDLPAPLIPVVFGVILVAGVGVLTGSLGDVIDEEAQLGMQSGARAKKEIERSKASYFKKKGL